MKIELKKICYSKELSEETNAFKASLYINGTKAGIAENDGHGGSTNYYSLNEKGNALIKESEAYCRNLPPQKYNIGGEEHQLDMDLELYIDNLLNDYLNNKDLQQFRKKLEKYAGNHIVIGVPDQSFRTLRLKFTVDLILVHPNGESVLADVIREKILPNLTENEKVLNANIPEKVLKKAGLSSDQYILPKPERQKNASLKAGHRKGKKL